MKITESSQQALFLRMFTIWETKDSPFLDARGWMFVVLEREVGGRQAEERIDEGHRRQRTIAWLRRGERRKEVDRDRCVGSRPRKIPVEGRFERKSIHVTPLPSRRSRIVPVMGR